MNCDNFDEYVDECFLGDRASFRAGQVLKHIESCDACAERMRIHKEYRKRMSALRAPNIHPVRTAKMIRRAIEVGETQQCQKKDYSLFLSGFAAALILSFGFMYGFSLFNTTLSSKTTHSVVSNFGSSRDITIVVNAPNDMHGAQLVFNLPADISISGQEHLASLNLPVNLKKGANVIVLPINLEPFAEYSKSLVMTASLIYKNSKKDFELDIDLGSSQKEKHEARMINASILKNYS